MKILKQENSITTENQNSNKILVAEDNLVNFYYLEAILQIDGYEVIHAKNGQEAIDYLKEDNNFKLVIMDISMPVLDGISATIIIRNQGIDTPILAHSASMQWDTAHMYANYGFEGFISKPVQRKILLNKIKEFM